MQNRTAHPATGRAPESRWLPGCGRGGTDSLCGTSLRLVPMRSSVDPLEFVISLAQSAGALLRDRFDDPHEIIEKRPQDLVTEADRASEAAIVAAIRSAFPGATILAEEGGVYAASGGDER